jgi:hypothetical protein
MTTSAAYEKTRSRELPLVLPLSIARFNCAHTERTNTEWLRCEYGPSSEAALAMLAVIVPAVIVSDIMMAGNVWLRVLATPPAG